MIQALTRFVFVTAGLLGGYATTRLVDWQSELGLPRYYVIFLFIILGGAIGFLLGGIIGREATATWRRAEDHIRTISSVDILLATGGLVTGLLVSLLASQPLRLIRPEWLSIATTVLIMVVVSYFAVGVALTRRREFALAFPSFAPNELAAAEGRSLLLDTSVVIDGRFVELSNLGFMPGQLRVPRFVLAELQTLADSSDDTRRARGRRGLDLLAALPEQSCVTVFEADYNDTPLVDEKLMRLAVDAHGALVTVDYNLTKVARVRGIDVMNLNEAAGSLRPNFLPGENVRIRVAKSGKEADQGVGYLEDGTMVVVQNGRELVGHETDVEVTSVLQTSAGRMIFARPAAGTHGEASEAGSL